MAVQTLPTQYAPARRAARKRLNHQAARVSGIPLIQSLFDAIPDIVLILNTERQIVFANQALRDLIHLSDRDEAVGFRPGEVLDCIHATETEGGCGTTVFCRACGALQAILGSLEGETLDNECRIILRNGDALDLQVYASPLYFDDQPFSMFLLKDISHEKRRQMLERVFFHDILNSASALRGLAEVMERAPMEDKNEVARDIAAVCDRLIDEIKSQKELSAAENNQLSVEHSLISSRPFLEELVHFYQNHDVCRSRQLYLDPDVCQTLLISDRTLLWRVLSNMVKNALEACVPGETVTLGCRLHNRHVEFWVHNPDVISETVRLQIFQRSFSTKGPGRGLGTYSIKLLGERYLRGRVSFTSSASRGTTFKIVLPLQ